MGHKGVDLQIVSVSKSQGNSSNPSSGPTQTGTNAMGTSTNATKANSINFVIVFALIAEFCSRWIINIFDVSFAEYSEEKFKLTSLEFR